MIVSRVCDVPRGIRSGGRMARAAIGEMSRTKGIVRWHTTSGQALCGNLPAKLSHSDMQNTSLRKQRRTWRSSKSHPSMRARTRSEELVSIPYS
jgi:hypothetical protein